MNIGYTIRKLRKEKGLKQVDFAKKSGLSQSYLSLIEKEKKEPTLGTLRQISEALSMPLPVLMFMSIGKEDVISSKRGAYADIEPSIKDLLRDIYLSSNEEKS